ncbi:MAG: tetratricopeptide repeat protein [Paenibacillus sp.]|jgi:tetratricopeptide (TPR) repeat protein|uniref:tetratricopeptide repeat protein n=1 Tax=Paenibacillus sp. TaxID=58172 RepID=UPI00290B6136|nr:tetratricopeptide repeat protein [Paenibacillus sp.]MDU4695163.1 tetratricopeptide repeat protein [Paenibacillus sp.]
MRSPTGQPQNMGKLVEMIQNAVTTGRLDVAEQLAGQTDHYLLSELVQSLYKEGYVTLAKERLMQMEPQLLRNPSPPFLEISLIWAEICYDEKRYDEAAPIFEAIAEQNPDFAAARFGAASCYLQVAIANLERRIQLYHPPKAEQEKICKYLDDFHQALNLIQTSGWHTEWNAVQVRHFPAKPATLLH